MLEKDLGKEKLEVGKKIVSFIGPEGSGKTTLALLLAEDSGKPYLTTGDTIRDYAKNDPGRLGEACRIMFAEHRYLAGELLLEIMSSRFSRDDTTEGFILDGGFRTVEETQDFQMTLESAGRGLPVTVIYLKIPIEESFKRLITGENARRRDDDTEEVLRCRLEKFNHQLDERLGIIMNSPNWDIIEVDATEPIEIVYGEVCNLLMQHKTGS